MLYKKIKNLNKLDMVMEYFVCAIDLVNWSTGFFKSRDFPEPTCHEVYPHPLFSSAVQVEDRHGPDTWTPHSHPPKPPGSPAAAQTTAFLDVDSTHGKLHKCWMSMSKSTYIFKQILANFLPNTDSWAFSLSLSPTMLEATHTKIPESLFLAFEIVSFPPRT